MGLWGGASEHDDLVVVVAPGPFYWRKLEMELTRFVAPDFNGVDFEAPPQFNQRIDTSRLCNVSVHHLGRVCARDMIKMQNCILI